MKLWVGRHCVAGPASTDPKRERERPLIPEGVATATAIAKALKAAGEVPNVIFCSPFTRATMTADIYGKILGVQVNVIGDLAPMRPMEDTILGLMAHGEQKRIMIVTHVDNSTPSMNNLGGDSKWKDLVMGEVRRVKIDRKSGQWSLRWGMKPSDLGLKDYASTPTS